MQERTVLGYCWGAGKKKVRARPLKERCAYCLIKKYAEFNMLTKVSPETQAYGELDTSRGVCPVQGERSELRFKAI
jgi:hypothetical protein